MRHNVTTPGGFFVGLGGIIAFCVVSALVYCWVTSSGPSDDLYEARLAAGLAMPKDMPAADVAKKKTELDAIFKANGHKDSDARLTLDQLREIVRKRAADKALAEGNAALNAPVAWKDKAKGTVAMPVELAMAAVAKDLANRKPKESAVPWDIITPADPTAAPTMPNVIGGGTKTVIFPDPNAKPVAPVENAKPVAPPAEPAKPAAPAPAAPEPNRPPLLK